MGVVIEREGNGYLLRGQFFKQENQLTKGGFYEKELEIREDGVYVELKEGDLNLVNYRDEIHSKEVGWKSPLVELISSFMIVVYLIKKGVIYEPYRTPLNFIHNKNTMRVQVIGRKERELEEVDSDFLEWVMNMIAFIISEEKVEVFEEFDLLDYARELSDEKMKMLSGYLDNRNLEELFEYTIEESVRSVLDDYLTIGKTPLNNKPSIQALLVRMEREERERKKEEELIKKKEEELKKKKEIEDKKKKGRISQQEEKSKKGLFGGIFSKREDEESRQNKENKKEYSAKQKLLREDDLDKYRKDLGIKEDKGEIKVKNKFHVVDLIYNLIGIGVFTGALYIAYQFYIWLVG